MIGAMVIYGLFAALMILIVVAVLIGAAVSAIRKRLRRGKKTNQVEDRSDQRPER